MPAATSARTSSDAAAAIADRTNPVPNVGIDEECPVCLEPYNEGAESCLSLKACGHLICKACIERLDYASNGWVRCPICRTSWLNVPARRTRHTGATLGMVNLVPENHPVSLPHLENHLKHANFALHQHIDLTLDDDSTLSDNSQREQIHGSNQAIGNIRIDTREQRVTRNQRWREFREARARQQAARADQRVNRTRADRSTATAVPSLGRIERPRNGRLRAVRRGLLDELSTSPSNRLAQTPSLQEPSIETEESDQASNMSGNTRTSHVTPMTMGTDNSRAQPNRRARQTAVSPRTPRRAHDEQREAGLTSQDGPLRTRIKRLERRKRELETLILELHDNTERTDHLSAATAQRDAALTRKEASLDDRERRLVARENLAQRHRIEMQGFTRRHQDETERVFQRHSSEMEEVLQRQRTEVDTCIYEEAGEVMQLE